MAIEIKHKPRTEFAYCKVCRNKFERNISLKRLVKQRSIIRGKKYVTCSVPCSRIYRNCQNNIYKKNDIYIK